MSDSLKISIVRLLVLRPDLHIEDIKVTRNNLDNGIEVCVNQSVQVVILPDDGVCLAQVNKTTYCGNIVNPIDQTVEYYITATVDISTGAISTVSNTRINGSIQEINHVIDVYFDISATRSNKRSKRRTQ